MSEDTIETIDVTAAFEPLQQLIRREGSNRSELWQAWHFLQVYAHWGIRLPTTEGDFKAIMPETVLTYDFFEPMQEGNQTILAACEAFLKDAFDEVAKIGVDLKRYAENAAKGEDALLQIILDMIEEDDTETALELLTDLQEDANSASERAGKVQKALSGFRTDLGKALGKLDLARSSLETDSRTNDETLGVLAGDEKTEGSIAYYHKRLEDARARLAEAAVASGTSPLYFWVIPPIGLIATGVVGIVYGVKVIERIQEIEDLEDKIQKGGEAQKKALAARNVLTQGANGLTNVITYTEVASAKCGVVQDAWKNLSSHIEAMAKWMAKSTKDTPDGGLDIAKKRLLSVALGKVQSEWQALLPDLTDLTTDTYVSIEPGTATLAAVQKELSEQQ